MRRSNERSAAEHQTLTEKLWDINLFIDNTEQQIKKSTGDKQNLMVDENILKLEIRRLRNILNQRADDVMRCVPALYREIIFSCIILRTLTHHHWLQS